jgi:hypothetical protein
MAANIKTSSGILRRRVLYKFTDVSEAPCGGGRKASETSVNFSATARRNIPVDRHILRYLVFVFTSSVAILGKMV